MYSKMPTEFFFQALDGQLLTERLLMGRKESNTTTTTT